MSGLTRMVVVVCTFAVVAGCTGSDEATNEVTNEVTTATNEVTDHTTHDHASTRRDTTGGSRKVSEMDRSRYVPRPSPAGGLTPAIRDTLRRLKKRHLIHRDEYWDEEGGVLANDHLEVWYPAGRTTVTHAIRVFNVLMPARHKLKTYFGTVPEERPVISFPPDLKVYKQTTGREWWYYSEISGDSITFQPIFVMVKRGIDGVAMPHEYFQWAIQKMSRYGAPRWLEEGFASYLSAEGGILEEQMFEFPGVSAEMKPDRIELILGGEESREESRIAYYRSYRMVKQLVETYGDDKLKEAITLLGEGRTLDEAFRGAFGGGYDDVLRVASEYSIVLEKP